MKVFIELHRRDGVRFAIALADIMTIDEEPEGAAIRTAQTYIFHVTESYDDVCSAISARNVA